MESAEHGYLPLAHPLAPWCGRRRTRGIPRCPVPWSGPTKPNLRPRGREGPATFQLVNSLIELERACDKVLMQRGLARRCARPRGPGDGTQCAGRTHTNVHPHNTTRVAHTHDPHPHASRGLHTVSRRRWGRSSRTPRSASGRSSTSRAARPSSRAAPSRQALRRQSCPRSSRSPRLVLCGASARNRRGQSNREVREMGA